MRTRSRQLIEGYVRATVPEEGAEDAVLARLLESESVPPTGRSRRGASLALAVGVAVALAACALLAVRGIVTLVGAIDRDRAPVSAPYHNQPPEPTSTAGARPGPRGRADGVKRSSDSPRPDAPAANTVDRPLTSGAAHAPGSHDRPADETDAVPPSRRGRPGGRTASALTREARLLAAAQAALRDGDPKRALSSLETHGQHFPRGAMAAERESLRAVALCSAGRVEEGRALAKRLLSGKDVRYAARIEAACPAEPPAAEGR